MECGKWKVERPQASGHHVCQILDAAQKHPPPVGQRLPRSQIVTAMDGDSEELPLALPILVLIAHVLNSLFQPSRIFWSPGAEHGAMCAFHFLPKSASLSTSALRQNQGCCGLGSDSVRCASMRFGL